jgi:arsenate reductase
MAEGLAREMFGASIRIQSAGSGPSQLNPLAVTAMAEIGVDISAQTAKLVETIDPGTLDTVVTLCAEAACPVFFGKCKSPALAHCRSGRWRPRPHAGTENGAVPRRSRSD